MVIPYSFPILHNIYYTTYVASGHIRTPLSRLKTNHSIIYFQLYNVVKPGSFF